VLDASAIAALESVAICLTIAFPDIGMTKLIAVVDVGTAMIFVVFARSLKAIVIAVARGFVELRGWCIPSPFLYIDGQQRCAFTRRR